MRARMALLLAGIQVELREVVLRDRPAHMMEISPKGTVPVLLLPNGDVIEESMDIMLWSLDESFLAGDWEDLVKGNDGQFKHHLDRYKYNNRYENPLEPEEHRSHVVEFLEEYNQRLSESAFLCGDICSLSDNGGAVCRTNRHPNKTGSSLSFHCGCLTKQYRNTSLSKISESHRWR